MNVVIHKKLWRIHNGTPLCYMSYDDSTKQADKCKETGRAWAGVRSYSYAKDADGNWVRSYVDVSRDTFSFDNVPISGFKVVKSASRWSTSNVVWRIEDPRGFELEIYSGNMEAIIKHCNINKGLIHGECVWGRCSGKNVLLPADSDEYKSAYECTSDLNSKKISTRSIKPGMLVSGGRHKDVLYLGKFYEATVYGGGMNKNISVYYPYKTKHHFGISSEDSLVRFGSSLKITKVEGDAWDKTQEELLKIGIQYCTKDINDGSLYFSLINDAPIESEGDVVKTLEKIGKVFKWYPNTDKKRYRDHIIKLEDIDGTKEESPMSRV